MKPTALQRGASSAIVPRVEVEGLTEWDVYGDEAGGLPLRDSDDAFVTAAFAVPRSVGPRADGVGAVGRQSAAPWTNSGDPAGVVTVSGADGAE